MKTQIKIENANKKRQNGNTWLVLWKVEIRNTKHLGTRLSVVLARKVLVTTDITDL